MRLKEKIYFRLIMTLSISVQTRFRMQVNLLEDIKRPRKMRDLDMEVGCLHICSYTFFSGGLEQTY